MAHYNQVTPEIIEQLKAAAPGHVFTGEDINPDYMRDEMPIYGKKMPDVLVQPLTTEEVSAVMKVCNDNLIPVTPRGAGTGLVGASVSVLGGVMDGEAFTAAEAVDISKWPSREEQIAILLGQITGVGSKLSSQLIAGGANLASQIKQRWDKDGEEAAEEAPAA